MPREIMCAWGNCQEVLVAAQGLKITVTVTCKGAVDDRQSFCCHDHAALWLRKWDPNRTTPRSDLPQDAAPEGTPTV